MSEWPDWTKSRIVKKRRKPARHKFKIVDNKIVKIETETMLQISCVKRLRSIHPWLVFWAVPNGGLRDKKVAAILKHQGVIAGVPDIQVMHAAHGYHGLCVELKVGDNDLSEAQAEMFERLAKENYLCKKCYTLDEFMEIVNWYVTKGEAA